MSIRSYEARHRGPNRAIRKPRRLISGLALPTAAAAAVTLGATGAEVATSNQATTGGRQPTAGSIQTTAARATQIRDRRDKAAQVQIQVQAQAQALALSRATAAAQAARSAQRKDLAVRALAATHAAKLAARAHGWQMPIKSAPKTSGFGWRWGRLHAGEDFAAPVGTALVAMSTGTVVFAGEQSGFGNLVQIRYWDGTVSYFAHMSRISASTGQRVAPGQIVGQSGNTGHSTGPHLHLEIHPQGGAAVDPLPWLAARNIDS